MKIPDKVKIGNQIYEIEMCPKPDEGDVNCDGRILYDMSKIRVRNVLGESKDYQEFVFFHEVVHGIYNFMGIEQNEEIVDKIARGIHMVIKDNPEIFKG